MLGHEARERHRQVEAQRHAAPARVVELEHLLVATRRRPCPSGSRRTRAPACRSARSRTTRRRPRSRGTCGCAPSASPGIVSRKPFSDAGFDLARSSRSLPSSSGDGPARARLRPIAVTATAPERTSARTRSSASPHGGVHAPVGERLAHERDDRAPTAGDGRRSRSSIACAAAISSIASTVWTLSATVIAFFARRRAHAHVVLDVGARGDRVGARRVAEHLVLGDDRRRRVLRAA